MERSKKEAEKDLKLITANNVDFMKTQIETRTQLETIKKRQESVDNNISDLSTTITELFNGMKKTETNIDKIETNQNALTAMIMKMNESLTNLTTQMQNMERKPENFAPQSQYAQYANLSTEQRATQGSNYNKNPPWSTELQSTPNTSALYTQAKKETKSSSHQKSLEQTVIISPTQEKELASPSPCSSAVDQMYGIWSVVGFRAPHSLLTVCQEGLLSSFFLSLFLLDHR